MKSKRDIEKLAKEVFSGCITNGAIRLDRVSAIMTLLTENRMSDLGFSLAKTEVLPFLRIFVRLLNIRMQEETLSFCTAEELNEQRRHELTNLLQPQVHKQFTQFNINPDIIAGIHLQIGWDIIDDSLGAKLHTLERHNGHN